MKWIITCKLPSGTRFAFSHKDNFFALVPVDAMQVRHASAFNTKQEAEDYLEKQIACAPQLLKLGPFQVSRCLEPEDFHDVDLQALSDGSEKE
jgi:hypothetical protein